ncbi:hypothetical protein ULMS_16900 [Patiriisocius marinistellae]|uniref:Uncharacterized protein n=1 Tax=Patiriisocius marinistellae TaxID=2494560 RepID=A0A5J4FY93_9FLAO|nr:hypothetical protein [Patiriisocius marinistellae]GEQ86182.1 hypothetical protein ULMS_16900 [Patiriisocius marinistellae]
MELTDYLFDVLPIFIIELLALIAGLIYLKTIKPTKSDYLIVGLLALTFLIELMSIYSPIAYFSNYEYFGFIKDTKYAQNTWMYNIYSIISFLLYSTYFKWKIRTKWHIQLISILLWVFAITSIINLLFTDVFFRTLSVYTDLAGTTVLLFSIGVYHIQLLRSDEILNFKLLLPFYISIGATILSLCFVPFAIYGGFFKSDISEDFIQLQSNALLFVNLLVYSIYIFGFLICLKKKSY